MKTIKDKYLVVGADFAGFPLKEAVCEHLRKKGWKIEDLGVRKDSDLGLALKFLKANMKGPCFSVGLAWEFILPPLNAHMSMLG